MHQTAGSRRVSSRALIRCLDCGQGIYGDPACRTCGRCYPVVDGIRHAIGCLTGSNRISAAFYDGPNWGRFRPWERLFLWFQGPGVAAARRQVLRHLPRKPDARVLEIGIGDGENLPLLPPEWTVFGVDIARSQLSACIRRFPSMAGRLAWAEGEALPFADDSFDAVYSVGGFNYFRDPAAALREMRRVAKTAAPTIVADEIPDLYRFAPGHALGLDALDRWSLRRIGLDAEFIDMVFNHRTAPEEPARDAWPGYRRFPIWNRLGYCFVDHGHEKGETPCR